MFPPEQHAKVSPSRLQRIIDCPGSFQLAQKYEGSSEPSTYAAEGTRLHRATERYLQEKMSGPVPADIVLDEYSVELDEEQCAAVDDCLDYLKNIIRTIEGPYKLYIEARVYLKEYSEWLYECDGTCDIIIVTSTSIIVIDWKFGAGIAVYAAQNDQVYAYGAGALIEHGSQRLEAIEIHIAQPRLDNFDRYIMSPEDIHNWINSRVVPGVKLAYGKNPPFNPGVKQCRWCPASNQCRARLNFANQTAADIFGAHEKLPNDVSLEEMAKVLEAAPMYEAYIKDLRTFILRQLQNGIKVPGFKMVRGRSIRQWIDADKAEEFLNDHLEYDQVYTHKMISISAAEKINRKLKKDPEFQALIEKPPGKLTMTTESDKRPAVSMETAADKFKDA